MEGFLDIKLPIWKRVSLTRLFAILPALSVSFMDGYFDKLDNYLNILQSVMLPFAMVPLLMFVSRRNIMGQFAISRKVTIFAIVMALVLIALNIVDFFPAKQNWVYYVVMTIIVVFYLGICALVASRPVPKIYLDDAPKLTEQEQKL